MERRIGPQVKVRFFAISASPPEPALIPKKEIRLLPAGPAQTQRDCSRVDGHAGAIITAGGHFHRRSFPHILPPGSHCQARSARRQLMKISLAIRRL